MNSLFKVLAAVGVLAAGSAAAHKLIKKKIEQKRDSNDEFGKKSEYMSSIGWQDLDCLKLVDHEVKVLFDRTKLESIMRREDYAKLKRVVLCGAGDSWNCAGVISEILPELTGISYETWDPLKATRFVDKDRLTLGVDPRDMLGIGITAGGGTARVAEWLEKMRACGIRGVCVTNNPEGKCAKAADIVFCTETPVLISPTVTNTPGLRSYCANLLACIAIGCYAGICNGTLPEDSLETWGDAIKAYVHSWENVADEIDNQMFELAKVWKDLWKFDYIGDGPQYYTAQFSEEKPVETAGVLTSHADCEDWCHINLYCSEPETIGTTFLVDDNSPSLSRMIETVNCAVKLGRPVLVITNLKDVSVISSGAEICKVPESPEGFKWMMPLMDFFPVTLFANYLCTLNSRMYFGCYDTDKCLWDEEKRQEIFWCLTTGNSKIEIHK